MVSLFLPYEDEEKPKKFIVTQENQKKAFEYFYPYLFEIKLGFGYAMRDNLIKNKSNYKKERYDDLLKDSLEYIESIKSIIKENKKK